MADMLHHLFQNADFFEFAALPTPNERMNAQFSQGASHNCVLHQILFLIQRIYHSSFLSYANPIHAGRVILGNQGLPHCSWNLLEANGP